MPVRGLESWASGPREQRHESREPMGNSSPIRTMSVGAALLAMAGLGALPGSARAQQSQSLLEGESRSGWEVAEFIGSGHVELGEGRVMLGRGNPMTGITWTGPFPRFDYEVTLEAKRVEGHDFFSAITFPVGEAHCTLVVGGWGGSVVGLSSLEGSDASENETTRWMRFENDRWYRIRLRVSEAKIEAWIEDEHVVDLSHSGRLLSVRVEVLPNLPFGIATWNTAAEVRNLEVHRLSAAEGAS